MLCAACELTALHGTMTVDGRIICADCLALELYECIDCGHIVDDINAIQNSEGATLCPECRAAESFQILEVE